MRGSVSRTENGNVQNKRKKCKSIIVLFLNVIPTLCFDVNVMYFF